jgi:hypothetical protein
MAAATLLQIQDGLIICRDDELAPFISHPDHRTILNHIGLDVRIRDGKKLLELVKGKYNLRIVKSLLIQSQYV